ncbi:MAG: VWA domain-containing protein [Candidatus Dormibacteraeota bacterium]|nr:VWA domain-containing protein [Candidatus Dormibacteraeota bacterium]MDQ6899754.1 VWA domain-containing protein [Candidatus Dormibacteraeota bacterium]
MRLVAVACVGALLLLSGAAQPAQAAAPGASTVFVLDISGSMDSPGIIPPDFPGAAKLKQSQDAIEQFIEQAKPGKKVTLKVLFGAIGSLGDFIHSQSDLNDWMTKQGIDPKTISKLYGLKIAATAMLNALAAERAAGLDERAGLVTFSSDASVLANMNSNPGSLQSAVAGLATQGSTNIGDGLDKALGLLHGAPNPAIVLITDGWNNTGMTNAEVLSGPTQRAAAQKIPICTIGIGQSHADVDQPLLTSISNKTGGGYYFVGDGISLQSDMLACHHSLGRQLLADLRGYVQQGQTVQAGVITVPAQKTSLLVTLSWPVGALSMRLTDPSGRTVAGGYPGARVSNSPGLETVSVSNPPAGTYKASVAGEKTAAAGDPFSVAASSDGVTASPHHDTVTIVQANNSDVVLDRIYLVRNVGFAILALLLALAVFSRLRRPKLRPAAAPVAYQAPPPGAPVPVPAPQAPPEPASGFGCGGCLWWMFFGLAVLVVGAAYGALWLWQTPILTMPQI